jgi:hypothetical protein
MPNAHLLELFTGKKDDDQQSFSAGTDSHGRWECVHPGKDSIMAPAFIPH